MNFFGHFLFGGIPRQIEKRNCRQCWTFLRRNVSPESRRGSGKLVKHFAGARMLCMQIKVGTLNSSFRFRTRDSIQCAALRSPLLFVSHHCSVERQWRPSSGADEAQSNRIRTRRAARARPGEGRPATISGAIMRPRSRLVTRAKSRFARRRR